MVESLVPEKTKRSGNGEEKNVADDSSAVCSFPAAQLSSISGLAVRCGVTINDARATNT